MYPQHLDEAGKDQNLQKLILAAQKSNDVSRFCFEQIHSILRRMLLQCYSAIVSAVIITDRDFTVFPQQVSPWAAAAGGGPGGGAAAGGELFLDPHIPR